MRHLKTIGVNQKQVKSSIDSLLAANEIEYTYHFGNTFLELSYNKPVRVTDSIVLKPPVRGFKAKNRDIVINIKPGASFGSGRHPTTRLCLAGLEFLLQNEIQAENRSDGNVLDIGTGAGVLLIAAVKMGLSYGMGVDVDACAVAEAQENIRLNALDKRVQISSMPVENVQGRFFLVMANLRLPTLERLEPLFAERTRDDGYLVLSGLKAEEMTPFQMHVKHVGRFKLIWQRTELGWGAMVLKKRPASD